MTVRTFGGGRVIDGLDRDGNVKDVARYKLALRKRFAGWLGAHPAAMQNLLDAIGTRHAEALMTEFWDAAEMGIVRNDLRAH
jgi:hypothetical protein